MMMSGHFIASLAMLLVAAIFYAVAVGTNSWSVSGQGLTLGLWQFCMDIDGDKVWTCLPNTTDFSVAGQAFSLLAVLCYAVSFLLYLACLVLPSLGKSRILPIALCLLAFSIVCLQMMTMIVYGVKMERLYRRVDREHFRSGLAPLTIAWSFAFAIVSSLIATAASVCTFLQLRTMALQDTADTGIVPTV